MPSGPWVVPALLLALTLVVSGAAKVRGHESTASAFRSLRLPPLLNSIGAPRLLPYAEFALALLLLVVPGPGYVIVAGLSLVLFTLYLVVVWRALGFAEQVHCNCFGALGLGEIDRRTVVRNGFLFALALAALIDAVRGGSVIERFTEFDATSWGWLLAVIGAVLLTGLVMVGRSAPTSSASSASSASSSKSPAPPQPEAAGSYIRHPVPYGQLVTAAGEVRPLHRLAETQPTLLVALSLDCGSCQRTMDLLPDWARAHPMVRVVAIAIGATAQRAPDLGALIEWLDDPEQRVAATLGLDYPSAVLLAPDGLLAGGPEHGAPAIAGFLDDIHAELVDAGAFGVQ